MDVQSIVTGTIAAHVQESVLADLRRQHVESPQLAAATFTERGGELFVAFVGEVNITELSESLARMLYEREVR